jgi:hypothetical protein
LVRKLLEYVVEEEVLQRWLWPCKDGFSEQPMGVVFDFGTFA